MLPGCHCWVLNSAPAISLDDFNNAEQCACFIKLRIAVGSVTAEGVLGERKASSMLTETTLPASDSGRLNIFLDA
jgi:hypothetical protein